MASRKDFLDAESDFNRDYGLNFSIERYQQHRKLDNRLEIFDVVNNDEDEARREYADTLSEVLKIYFKNKTSMDEVKSYDMSDFSIGDFIERFDAVMKLKHESDPQKSKKSRYKPFEGIPYRTFANWVWDDIAVYNKPLHEIWAKNVVKDILPVDRMKEITNDAISRLDTAKRENIGNYEKDLTNLVVAKQAMKSVVKGRSFWWWIWIGNWNRNSEEKAYLKSLEEKITEYRDKGFPVDRVESVRSVLAGLRDRLDESVESYDVRRAAELEQKAKDALVNPKEEEEYRSIADEFGIEVWEKISQDPTKALKLAQEIVNVLPSGAEGKLDDLFSYIKGDGFKSDINLIAHNLKIDANENRSVSYQMKNAMKHLRINTLAMARNMGYKDMFEREVVAQAIADVLISKLPIVTQSPEKYGQYAKGYMINNAARLLNDALIREQECDRLMDAKESYDKHMRRVESRSPIFTVVWEEEKEEELPEEMPNEADKKDEELPEEQANEVDKKDEPPKEMADDADVNDVDDSEHISSDENSIRESLKFEDGVFDNKTEKVSKIEENQELSKSKIME